MWDRLKTWFQHRAEQRRLRALEEQFAWLETLCRHAGESELAHLVSIAWESRCRGEHRHALHVLLLRSDIQVRASHTQERRPWV